jgi:release factor glutamine methyltransferase
LILCHVLGVSRTWLFLHNDDVLTTEQEAVVESALEKRLGGLPVAYITGEKEFYGRTFFVTQDVLIPKPDTELLVEKAVAYAKAALGAVARASSEAERSRLGADSGAGGEVGRQFRFADICTGSGCIAISVLAELLAAQKRARCEAGDSSFGVSCGLADGGFVRIYADATDISAAALAVARKNAESLLGGAGVSVGCCGDSSLGAERSRLGAVSGGSCAIQFFQGDLCAPLVTAGARVAGESGARAANPPAKYDMVLSNPPYVPATVTDELLKDGRGEPRLALDGDTDSAVVGTVSGDTAKTHIGVLSGDAARVGTARAESRGFQAASRETGDGLAIIRRLIPQVKEILLPGGVFFMETGEYNAEKAAEYLSKCGFTDIVIHRDLAGQLRLVESHL